jgi:hypothetical protein
MAMDISNFASSLRKFGIGGGKQSKGLSEDELKKAFAKNKSAVAADTGKTDLSPIQPDGIMENPAIINLQQTPQDKIDEEELKNKRKSYFA